MSDETKDSNTLENETPNDSMDTADTGTEGTTTPENDAAATDSDTTADSTGSEADAKEGATRFPSPP